MKGMKVVAILTAVVMALAGQAIAGDKCTQGAQCSLGIQTYDEFGGMTYEGGVKPFAKAMVDGMALRRQSDNEVWIFFAADWAKLQATKPQEPVRFWKVAICGANTVRHAKWENNQWADQEVLISSGQYQNCDNFDLKNNTGVDGMLIDVRSNQLKIHVEMDGGTSGYGVYANTDYLPARATWFHFKVK